MLPSFSVTLPLALFQFCVSFPLAYLLFLAQCLSFGFVTHIYPRLSPRYFLKALLELCPSWFCSPLPWAARLWGVKCLQHPVCGYFFPFLVPSLPCMFKFLILIHIQRYQAVQTLISPSSSATTQPPTGRGIYMIFTTLGSSSHEGQAHRLKLRLAKLIYFSEPGPCLVSFELLVSN